MVQRLNQRGVRCIEYAFTTESRRKLFGRLLDLIEAGRIKIRYHAELKKQLLSLVAKRLPSGGWRIDHRSNSKDDLVVAIGLALEGLPDHSGVELQPGIGQRIARADVPFEDLPSPGFPMPGRIPVRSKLEFW